MTERDPAQPLADSSRLYQKLYQPTVPRPTFYYILLHIYNIYLEHVFQKNGDFSILSHSTISLQATTLSSFPRLAPGVETGFGRQPFEAPQVPTLARTADDCPLLHGLRSLLYCPLVGLGSDFIGRGSAVTALPISADLLASDLRRGVTLHAMRG